MPYCKCVRLPQEKEFLSSSPNKFSRTGYAKNGFSPESKKNEISAAETEIKLCDCCKELICQSCKAGLQERVGVQNKVLTTELALFDDNCHLLGYLAEGTVIKGLYCPQSNNFLIGDMTITNVNKQNKCPQECLQATKYGKPAPFPRWVKRTDFDEASRDVC